jgi:hypothetical protein
MNWNAVGAIGQILGSLATFVTVGYLVVQVHDSETESRRALAQTRMQRTLDMGEAMVSNPSLADLELRFDKAILQKNLSAVPASSTFRGNISFITNVVQEANATDADAYLLLMHYFALWNNFSDTIIHIDELLPMDRLGVERDLRATLGNPGFAFWYQTFRQVLVEQAVNYVDSLNIGVGDGRSLSSPGKAGQAG